MEAAFRRGTSPIGLLAVVLVALTQLVGANPARADVTAIYVDKTMSTCSETGSGTSSSPYCSITKAISRLQAGDTLYVGNGTYGETIKPTVSGTAAAPVTITSWPGKRAVIGTGVANGANVSARSYVTVSGLSFSGTTREGILVSGSDHITLSGNEVSNAGKPAQSQTAPGISVKSTTSSVVKENFTHHNSDSGISLASGTTGTTVAYNESSFNARGWQRNANGINVVSPGNTVIGNRTHDNEDSGIQFYAGGDNNLATLNVTYNNGDHGIDDLNVTGGRLIGNTVFRNCTTGINVEGTSGNYVVKNNIAVDNAVYPAYNGISCSRRAGNIGIWDSAPSTTVVDHNLVWLSKPGNMYVFNRSYSSLSAMQAATGQEGKGVQGDPRFDNASAWALSLAAGSPAVDRADSGAPGAQGQDIVGHARVDDPATSNAAAEGPRLYDDLGAYEFDPGTSPAPSPPTARLTVSPATGTVPLVVTADASASTDPQGQTLSYTFDFGDGTSTGPQPGATASHTYPTADSYTVRVTVTNTSDLTNTASQTVTGSAPVPQTPPTARLTVSPATGTVPLVVTADASASTDPQGQTLSYTFDFGDGTSTGPQPGATASHTYPTADSYTVRVTVTNTSDLTNTASQTVTGSAPVPQQAPAYVSSIANNYSTSTKTSGYISVWRSAGVQAGDFVVLTLQLAGTAGTGPVSARDDAGNTYSAASDVADGAGNRLVILAGVATVPLGVNARITATFPTATGYRMAGDEFSGVTRVDRAVTASGTSATFSSGATATTSASSEAVFGAVSIAPGSADPAWASGWRDIGSYAVGTRYLGRAYQLQTSPGTFTASGTASGPWLATAVTFRP